MRLWQLVEPEQLPGLSGEGTKKHGGRWNSPGLPAVYCASSLALAAGCDEGGGNPLPGNLLAFGSPDSAKMGDLVVAAFTGAKPDALQGSQVLFIGKPADRDRVKAAAEAAGAKFIFVEAK